jgi:hypothetical protein
MAKERPLVTAQSRVREHTATLAGLPLAARFSYIYRHNLWGSEETRSGLGSSLEETRVLRERLTALFDVLSIESLLDIPCGDFHWLSTLPLPATYIGADIVPEIVAANQAQYAAAGRSFQLLDITTSPLPAADLILCRDCLVHLSYANIHDALRNVRASGARYLLMTHFPEQDENQDIFDGDWRPLNFTLAPFHLPAPEAVLIEECAEGDGAFGDKSLGLWRVDALPA